MIRSNRREVAGRAKNRRGNLGSEKKEGSVIIAGNLNMARCRELVGERVKRDTRVKAAVFPGQTVRTMLGKEKYKLRRLKKGQNLLVIAGGLSGVLRGNGASI